MDERKLSIHRYGKDPGSLLEALGDLISRRGKDLQADLALQMVEVVLKVVRDGAPRGDLKVLNHALKELRYAFKVFRPYREIRKVSIFGSARTMPDDPAFEAARTFANLMTRRGYMVITGAGSGIMEAAQGGAGRARSFGVNIRLPFEQKANEIIQNDSKLVHFKYFFTRKVVFVKETDAIAIFPGGFGTHDEAFESLTLVQTGKSDMLPIVFVDQPGGTYWDEWLEYVEKHLKSRGFIDPDDTALFTVTNSPEQAAEVISRFYANYHSMRFIRSRLVIRLRRQANDEVLARLNEEFADMLVKGKIERLEHPLAEEADEPESHHLSRLVLFFDRKSYGRLRRVVDRLNAEPR